MSVLLVGPPSGLGEVVAQRLMEQGDQVRVLVPEEESDVWRALGVHVAPGDPSDTELVDLAATGSRSIVSFSDGPAGATAPARRIVVTDRPTTTPEAESFVVLVVPRRRLSRGRALPDGLLAEAIDAADDLAGEPRLELDLSEDGSWLKLGLEPPNARR